MYEIKAPFCETSTLIEIKQGSENGVCRLPHRSRLNVYLVDIDIEAYSTGSPHSVTHLISTMAGRSGSRN